MVRTPKKGVTSVSEDAFSSVSESVFPVFLGGEDPTLEEVGPDSPSKVDKSPLGLKDATPSGSVDPSKTKDPAPPDGGGALVPVVPPGTNPSPAIPPGASVPGVVSPRPAAASTESPPSTPIEAKYHSPLVGEYILLWLLFALSIFLIVKAPRLKRGIRTVGAVIITLVWLFDNPNKGVDFINNTLQGHPETPKGRTLALIFYWILPITVIVGLCIFFFIKLSVLVFSGFLGVTFQRFVMQVIRWMTGCECWKERVQTRFCNASVFWQAVNLVELFTKTVEVPEKSGGGAGAGTGASALTGGEVATPAAAAVIVAASSSSPSPLATAATAPTSTTSAPSLPSTCPSINSSSSFPPGEKEAPFPRKLEAILNLISSFFLFTFATLMVIRCFRGFYHLFMATLIAILFISTGAEICIFTRYRFSPYCGNEEVMVMASLLDGGLAGGGGSGGISSVKTGVLEGLEEKLKVKLIREKKEKQKNKLSEKEREGEKEGVDGAGEVEIDAEKVEFEKVEVVLKRGVKEEIGIDSDFCDIRLME